MSLFGDVENGIGDSDTGLDGVRDLARRTPLTPRSFRPRLLSDSMDDLPVLGGVKIALDAIRSCG
jgi:hypothetical protein